MAVARKFDPETAVGQWDGEEFSNKGLVHGREYTEEELVFHLNARFLKQHLQRLHQNQVGFA